MEEDGRASELGTLKVSFLKPLAMGDSGADDMVAPVDGIACQLARSSTYVMTRATSRSRFSKSSRTGSSPRRSSRRLLRRRRGWFGDMAWTLSDNAAAEEMWNVRKDCSILFLLL